MNVLLFTIIKNKAADYYRENFGPVLRMISDHEENTFSLNLHNPEYKYPAKGTKYEMLSEGVERIKYRLDLDFEHYGITLPTKQIKAVKCVEVIDKRHNNFKVTYTITDVKDDELYFTNWNCPSVCKSISMFDCAKKLVEFIENTFFKDAFVMCFNNQAKRFTVSMNKDLQSITDYFIVTNVEPFSTYKMFFKCIKTCPSPVNPEFVEQTYSLDAICPIDLIVECGAKPFNFIGKIVEEEDFDEPNSCASVPDPVNHPNHYEMVGPFESFDIIVESLGIEVARFLSGKHY